MKHWPFHLHDLCLSQILESSLLFVLWILYLFLIPLFSSWNSSYWSIDRLLFYSSCLNFPFIPFYCILALCCIQTNFVRLVFSSQVRWSCMFNHTLIQCWGFLFNFRDNVFHFKNSICPFQICLHFLNSVCLCPYFQVLLLHV